MVDNRLSNLDLEGSPAKSLFFGNILEENLFPYPKISESETETLRMVLDSVRRFMEGKEDEFREYDRAAEFPSEFIESLKELGLFALIIPEEFGGIGLSNSSYSRVLQEICRYDGSTSVTVGAHSSIGMKGILLFGTDEQKRKYLPRLTTGELIAAFCLTEAGAGSDAAAIKTTAKREKDGSWILDGEKIWISNGSIADLFTVFARTDSDGGKLSAFLVERAFTGVTNGPKEIKMGIRASPTTAVRFDRVHLPPDALLGEEGKGFKIAMSILNNGRTGLGGGIVGGIKHALSLATRQAVQRKQFGRSISEFALIKEKIARMTVDCYASESAVLMLGHYIDSGVEDFSIEAAICKVFASEAFWRSTYDALQVAGGIGYMSELPYERLVRDSRINSIFEGTNEILRLYIALSGMKEVGKYLREIGDSAAGVFNDPIKGFGVLSKYAVKKFSLLTSLGRDRLESVPSELAEDASVYEKCTSEFGLCVEGVLRRYGTKIIGTQLLSKRVADIAIDLCVGLCVLSRVSRRIEEHSAAKCSEEILISRLFAHDASRRIAENLRGIEKNLDEELGTLGDAIFAKGEYPWDII